MHENHAMPPMQIYSWSAKWPPSSASRFRWPLFISWPHFNNIMDVLQLVFAFVNAPLFETFLLGMFWKHATGREAFFGLISGTVAAADHHGLTISAGSTPGVKGAWIATVHVYPSQMAENLSRSLRSGLLISGKAAFIVS
jgi:hypothetical protein